MIVHQALRDLERLKLLLESKRPIENEEVGRIFRMILSADQEMCDYAGVILNSMEDRIDPEFSTKLDKIKDDFDDIVKIINY